MTESTARDRAHARGLEQIESLRAEIDREGGTLHFQEVVARLPLSLMEIGQRTADHRLVCVPGPEDLPSVLYPAFQFTETGVLDGIDALGAALEPAGHWSRLAWLLGPDHELGGDRPLDALRRGEVDRVMAAARSLDWMRA